jgi:hypothetical protein
MTDPQNSFVHVVLDLCQSMVYVSMPRMHERSGPYYILQFPCLDHTISYSLHVCLDSALESMSSAFAHTIVPRPLHPPSRSGLPGGQAICASRSVACFCTHGKLGGKGARVHTQANNRHMAILQVLTKVDAIRLWVRRPHWVSRACSRSTSSAPSSSSSPPLSAGAPAPRPHAPAPFLPSPHAAAAPTVRARGARGA